MFGSLNIKSAISGAVIWGSAKSEHQSTNALWVYIRKNETTHKIIVGLYATVEQCGGLSAL